MLHRDIRPTNIILSDGSPLSTAVLIDFSLGCDAGTGIATSEDSLDTARYRSPEHAGSMDYDVGATSDLYSAGIVLFECLAGHPPFGGDTVGAVLLTHMTSHVPELRAAGLDIPRPLDELIQRLLRKDPRDRYQTAEAVLLDLEGIAASLRSGAAESAYVVGLHDRRPTLTEPAFVGHQSDLQQVDEQIRQVAAGQTSLVFVEAESGGGKTRLLAEVALRGAQNGMWVLHGCGLEMVGQRPFQVLHGVVEDVDRRGQSSIRPSPRPCTNVSAITPPPSAPCCRNWLAAWAGESPPPWGRRALPRRGAFRRWPPSSLRSASKIARP